jgi:hypothetical protein
VPVSSLFVEILIKQLEAQLLRNVLPVCPEKFELERKTAERNIALGIYHD